ncbi:unnamed protein product [Adineta steineri]|uniref:Uncharacterized protein n=1 Tax=Adineta steineri TaxID=433720 RepID=A0A820AIT2_9BILA|nr:unnamed protein product [Adineta steineri]
MLFASQKNDNSPLQVPILIPERTQQLHAAAVDCIIRDGLPFGIYRKPGMALTSDLWRSSQRVHYISLTGHIFTNTYDTAPIVLGCRRIIGRHVSTNIERYITFELNRLQIKPEKMISITNDNGSDMNKATYAFKFGNRISCMGHDLSLVVKHGLCLWKSQIQSTFSFLCFNILAFRFPIINFCKRRSGSDLTRHRRRLVRSFERLYIPTPEQRTTSISERRMGIIKRIQLAMNYLIVSLFTVAGGRIRIRLHVVLSIIVPDMLSMIEEYTNALLSHYPPSQDKSKNNDSSSIEERRLKPIEERWRQTSKRNHGHYRKGPEQPTLNDLSSSLLASRNDVNDNLKLPNLLPDWINVDIGLILSAGNNSDNHRSISLLSLNNQLTCPLIDNIKTFIEQWSSSAANNTHNISFSVNNFSLLIDNFNDISQQCKFILERILLPFLPCDLIVNKVYTCSTCETTKTIRDTIRSIPVNVLRTGLHLEHDLFAYFAPTLSDLLCESCKKATTRHIEVLKWPAVLMTT